MRPGLIVGHQDAAPYNAVVDGERLVGFCDWDIAGPSSREWDLAFSMLPWVPLASPSPGPSDAPGRGTPGSLSGRHATAQTQSHHP
jgi:aminoglycoside phosphotransferase (APT) family kinase protein